jgi:MYXO-CTERM domain-containing protein
MSPENLALRLDRLAAKDRPPPRTTQGGTVKTPLTAKTCPALVALMLTGQAAAAPGPLLPGSPTRLHRNTPDARAREVLSARAPASRSLSLSHVGTYTRPDGSKLVRFRETHAGLPVLSRGASVLLDASGNPTTFATARLETRFPAQSTPVTSAAAAALAAGQSFSGTDGRLAWLSTPGGARLVWVFYRGLVPGTPRSPVVVVDAVSGRIRLAFDATRFDRGATVFEENPVATPTASAVTLSTLAQGATKLEDARIRALTCVDTQKLIGKWGIHMCELLPKVVADTSGDFPYTYASDTAAEDEFAEVSMYFHTAKAYAFYESLGMPELTFKPLTVVANLRFPQGWDSGNVTKMKDTSLPLEPYDNAFFSPQSPYPGLFQGVTGGLFFGQGKAADFAYDGDVVYHELGHALVDRTIDLAPYWLLDEQGASPAPGAMNEALSDYFSSALTGDGKVGEYAAKNTAYSSGEKVIRNLDNAYSCPKNIAGEVHIDSTFFSGALWSVRSALPEADRNVFDTALVTAMIGAPSGELGYHELGELFRAALEASSLGKPAADALAAELDKRGVFPRCKRQLEFKGQPISSTEWKLANGFFAAGRPYVSLEQSASYAPGLMQIHVPLESDTETLKVQWENHSLGGQYDLGPDAVPYTPALLVRFAADPMVFSYDAGVAVNADLHETDTSAGRTVTLDVPKGSTDAWVMVVNKGDEMGLYYDVTFVQKGPPPSTGGFGGTGGFGASGGTGGSGGSSASTGGSAGFDQPIRPVGGCAVAPAPAGTRGLAGLALSALAFGLARRRRR